MTLMKRTILKNNSNNMKRKAENIIRERNLCSYMNDTKWNELRNAMLNEMPFPPPFTAKYLFENDDEGMNFQEDVYCLGDWEDYDGYLDNWFAVEWIKIRPRYLKRRGVLIEPKIIDGEDTFIRILEKYNIPYNESNGTFCIYGYR